MKKLIALLLFSGLALTACSSNKTDANSSSSSKEKTEQTATSSSSEKDQKKIEEEQKKLIFTPFYTTNKQLGGSGLGLSIVYNLVTQKLDGKIEVDSEKGHGIKFTIIIPLQEDSMHG